MRMIQYTRFLCKWLIYKMFAGHRQGHGIHSPFLYRLVREVLMDKKSDTAFLLIESRRKAMLHHNKQLLYDDPGAGSTAILRKARRVKNIARTSAIRAKHGRLLFRLVRHFSPGSILELGTSTGISTLYLGSACPAVPLITIEAIESLSLLAKENAELIGLKNITFRIGMFDSQLGPALAETKGDLLVFIDGHHEKEATLAYVNRIIEGCTSNSLVILDDIHWSEGMEEAWKKICMHPAVTLSVDLFHMGLVFLRKELQQECHLIRY